MIMLRNYRTYVNMFFWVDHAYNQTKDMPYNIIRVSDWKEIHSWIKKLS